MQRSFLAKLQRSARLSLWGALLLLLIVPILQLVVLGPRGYGASLATPRASLLWIQGQTVFFLLDRLALILGFALLLVVPFALFRIIIAQEIVGRAELEEEEEDEGDYDDEDDEGGYDEDNEGEDEAEEDEQAVSEENGLPAFAWRGKGFAVLAAWTGVLGLLATVVGALGSTIYLWSSAYSISGQALLPSNYASVTMLFALLAYTVGGGLLALSCLLFGFVIARSGRKLWPDSWVFFGYAGLGVGAITSGSAVQIALAPLNPQASLTTPAILLFAAWLLWFSIMVARLKPE